MGSPEGLHHMGTGHSRIAGDVGNHGRICHRPGAHLRVRRDLTERCWRSRHGGRQPHVKRPRRRARPSISIAERTIRRARRVGDAQLARIDADFLREWARPRLCRTGVAWRGSVRRNQATLRCRARSVSARAPPPIPHNVAILRAQRIAGKCRLEAERPARRSWKASRATQVIP